MLGKGGFGKVQVVQSRLNGDYYALKSINKAWLVQSASNVQSVWLERHIMIQLRSPFLVPVYYAFQDAYYIYLVMHFMPGQLPQSPRAAQQQNTAEAELPMSLCWHAAADISTCQSFRCLLQVATCTSCCRTSA